MSVDARAAYTACYIFRGLPLVNQGIRSVFGGFGHLFGGLRSPLGPCTRAQFVPLVTSLSPAG